MPTTQRSAIVTQLVSNCVFPKRTALEDHTCHICQEASLGPDGGEIPIKLRCDHIVGMACLITWAFQQIEEVGNALPGCPFCRAPLQNREGPNRAAVQDSDQNGVISVWLPALAGWTPCGDEQYDQLDSAESWIQRAEQLWDDLCKEILDDLDVFDFTDGPGAAIEGFLCSNAVVAKQFLSFGTVFHFYQNYIRLGWRPDSGTISRRFAVPYHELTDHLRTAADLGIGEEEWRVRQAYYRPQNQLDVFCRRMERSRANLGERAAKLQRGW
ncbi:MAG: hypothetical protein L6R36_009003 [Xanthoria steineri]|nr:MAG: hypothetical protein L6R36_009003 [Xanthoria steineri]